jgi:hypothetical protein
VCAVARGSPLSYHIIGAAARRTKNAVSIVASAGVSRPPVTGVGTSTRSVDSSILAREHVFELLLFAAETRKLACAAIPRPTT